MTDRSLDDLHPILKPLCEQFLADCRAAGLTVRVTETWRDPKREDELHAKGITRATGASCKHCLMIGGKPASRAFDFICLDRDGQIISDGTDDVYTRCGAIGTRLGLKWGADFTHPDYDHLEMPEQPPT